MATDSFPHQPIEGGGHVEYTRFMDYGFFLPSGWQTNLFESGALVRARPLDTFNPRPVFTDGGPAGRYQIDPPDGAKFRYVEQETGGHLFYQVYGGNRLFPSRILVPDQRQGVSMYHFRGTPYDAIDPHDLLDRPHSVDGVRVGKSTSFQVGDSLGVVMQRGVNMPPRIVMLELKEFWPNIMKKLEGEGSRKGDISDGKAYNRDPCFFLQFEASLYLDKESVPSRPPIGFTGGD